MVSKAASELPDPGSMPGRGQHEAYAGALCATRIPMVISDPHQPDAPLVFANDAFLALTGYRREEVLGRNCRFLQGPRTDAAEVARVREALSRGESVAAEFLNYRRDGTEFWNALFVSPVRAEDGRLLYLAGSQIDVTRARENELVLQAAKLRLEREIEERTQELSLALAAKEVLLHEVDHRVKNNLQLIGSLITLQARRIPDAGVRATLQTMLARVTALSSVHHQLYRGADPRRFDLAAFAREIAESLLAASGREDVRLELSLEPILVGADKASPIALILNELLTNALKHAFPDGRGGRLSLTVRREGADLVAEIEDDGRGLATSASAPVGGFGSTLVQTLTRQLRGRLDWPAIPQGTRARLRLPVASDLDPGV